MPIPTWDELQATEKSRVEHRNVVGTLIGFIEIPDIRDADIHCAEHHLHRYLAEFDFRYTHRIARGIDDGTRALLALKGAKGKRLTYRRPVAG